VKALAVLADVVREQEVRERAQAEHGGDDGGDDGVEVVIVSPEKKAGSHEPAGLPPRPYAFSRSLQRSMSSPETSLLFNPPNVGSRSLGSGGGGGSGGGSSSSSQERHTFSGSMNAQFLQNAFKRSTKTKPSQDPKLSTGHTGLQ
jgi:hypothetical protein